MRFHSIVLLILFSLVLSAASGGEAPPQGEKGTPKPTVAELVGKVPVTTTPEGKQVIAELVARSPAAAKEIAGMLVAPGKGDDAKARFALHGMALYAAGPEVFREEVRLAVSGGIIEAIRAEERAEVKAFLIRQLALCGAHEAVAPLAGLLASERFCEPATQALTQIGTLTAAKALADALPEVDGFQRVTIIKALGKLRAVDYAAAILEYAGKQNKEVREAALWALATMGAPQAVEVLRKAAAAQGRLERKLGAQWYLLLARRLAEAGYKARALAICDEVLASARESGEQHLVMAAVHARTFAADGPGFEPLFNGVNLVGWQLGRTAYRGQPDDPTGYTVTPEGEIECKRRGGGKLLTVKKYSDFIFRFEFKLTKGANNGLGIRCPVGGDAAYNATELQIIDNEAHRLAPWQAHGSMYGVVPAKQGYHKPIGEWNAQEVVATGRRIRVVLNGAVILDADVDEALTNLPKVNPRHVGRHEALKDFKKGHIGFLGHGAQLWFRNIRIKEL